MPNWWPNMRMFRFYAAEGRDGATIQTNALWRAVVLAMLLRRRWQYVQSPPYYIFADGAFQAHDGPWLYEFAPGKRRARR
jgi:hypothetical protein